MDKVMGEFILFIILCFGWYFGGLLHNRSYNGSMILVKFPFKISRIFGKKGDDGHLNYHSFMFQMLILIYFIVMSLKTLEVINEQTVYYSLLIPIAAFTISGFILYLRQRK